MNYLDYRLSKILSDIRIEQSRPIEERGLIRRSDPLIEKRLALSPIAREEPPSGDRPKAA